MIATTTDYGTVYNSIVFSYTLPVYECAMEIPYNIFALFCHTNKNVLTYRKKREYYCNSVSVYEGLFYHRIFTVSPEL